MSNSDPKKRRAVDRQIERQRELREHALHYAASGEHLANFTVTLVDTAMQFVCSLPPRATSGKRAHMAWHELIDMLVATQTALEPWRGRVCLESVDEIVEMLTGDDDSGNDGLDDDEPAPEPPSTPVPAAFVKALA